MNTQNHPSVTARHSVPPSNYDSNSDSVSSAKNNVMENQVPPPVMKNKSPSPEHNLGNRLQDKPAPDSNTHFTGNITFRERAPKAEQKTQPGKNSIDLTKLISETGTKPAFSLSYGELLPLIKQDVHKKFSELLHDDIVTSTHVNDPAIAKLQAKILANHYPVNVAINASYDLLKNKNLDQENRIKLLQYLCNQLTHFTESKFTDSWIKLCSQFNQEQSSVKHALAGHMQALSLIAEKYGDGGAHYEC